MNVLIEGFEDYSAGIFNNNNNPRYNYLMAMNAIYNPPNYMNMYNPKYRYPEVCAAAGSPQLYEGFVSPSAQYQRSLYNSGDYVDYYHNLFNNV